MNNDQHSRDELEVRQDAVLHPIGSALRSTYPSDNHDSLGNDLTGLMLQLAHVDEERLASPGPSAPGHQPSWMRRLFGRLRD